MNIKAKVYLGLICLAGWLAVCLCIRTLALRPSLDPTWLALVIPLAFGRWYIQLPNCDGRINPTSLIIVYAALVEGPEAATVLALVEGVSTSFEQSQGKLARIAFNSAVLPLSIFLATGIHGLVGPFSPTLWLDALGHALVLAMGYYAVNMSLVLIMMMLAAGRAAVQAARAALLWSWLEYLISGLVAGILLGLQKPTYVVLTGVLLMTALTRYALAHYFEVLKSKQEALEENEALVKEKVNLLEQLHATHLASLETLALAIEAKDPLTHGHVRRVQKTSEALASRLGLPSELVENVRVAALLHDIGKLAIPEYVLYQDRKQTPEDVRKYQAHAALGADILRESRLDDVVPMVRHHHECWDGSGYPDQLQGEDIPLGARILAVADAYDKLRFPRTGVGCSVPQALVILREAAGVALDPQIVATFAEHVQEEAHLQDLATDDLGLDEEARLPLFEAAFIHDVQQNSQEAMLRQQLHTRLIDTHEPHTVMRHITELLQPVVPADGLIFLMPDGPDGELQPVYEQGALHETTHELLRRWAARAVTREVPTSSLLHHMVPESLEAPPFRAWTLFPLVLEDERRGGLVLLRKEATFYSEAQRRSIGLVIDNACSSLVHARAYDRYLRESTLDELTGLGNNRMLRSSGPLLVETALSRRHPLCVVLLDLNGFKAVNDTLGHHTGDRLLVDIAQILQRHALEGDLVVRNGGDEFVLVLPHQTMSSTRARMERIYSDACEIWPLRMEGIPIGTSCGIAVCQEDGQELEVLRQCADTRMYDDKRRKRANRRPDVLGLRTSGTQPDQAESAPAAP